MFAGSLKCWEKEKKYLPEVFDRAIKLFLEQGGISLSPGHYELEGKDIYVNVEEGVTKSASERRFEMHRAYIDIQIVLEGSERMDYCLLEPEENPTEEDFKVRDIAFYPDLHEAGSVFLGEGEFAVFLPSEPHAPNLATGAPSIHKKAVIKIRAELAA